MFYNIRFKRGNLLQLSPLDACLLYTSWKAKQIQDEHKGTYLYIVFTKALMQYMADGISQVGIPQRNVDYHWHWQNRAGCPSADYIIVDEAQDFSKEDIELFRSKAKKALLLYGDSAQQL